jgi:hypothetical protein
MGLKGLWIVDKDRVIAQLPDDGRLCECALVIVVLFSNIVKVIRVCRRAGRSTGKTWQGGEGQDSETRWVASFLDCVALYLCYLCKMPKDSLSAHKGLMTSWPHHNTKLTDFVASTHSALTLCQMILVSLLDP